jgi:hypothetical protein
MRETRSVRLAGKRANERGSLVLPQEQGYAKPPKKKRGKQVAVLEKTCGTLKSSSGKPLPLGVGKRVKLGPDIKVRRLGATG